jgi:hypothetical protein
VRALPRVPAGRWGGRQLPRRGGLVVVRCSVPEVDVGVPDLGERREDQAVHRRRERPVPDPPRAVRAGTPAGRLPGQPAQPGEQRPHRCGQPRRGGGEPDRGAQQVHGEVGGERDGRLELGVHRRRTRGRRNRGRRRSHPGGRDRDRAPPVAQPVDPQRRAPPAQVCPVGTGAPAGQAPVGPPPAGRDTRPGSRRAAGLDAQHPHREPDGQPDREVGREVGAEVQLGRLGGAGAEQPGETGGPGGAHVGTGARCDLHCHRCRLPGGSCRGRGRDRGQGGTYGRRRPRTPSRDTPVRPRDRTVAGPAAGGR